MIENNREVRRWLEGLTEGTRRWYLHALADFCFAIEKKPDEMLEIAHREEEDRVPSWRKSINKWFEKYDEHNKKYKRRKKTRDARRAAVKSFFHFYELSTPRRKRRVKENGFKKANIRDSLTKKDIKKLLDACKTWKMRAIILTQASSGLSISDVLGLTVGDFRKGIREFGKHRICMLSLRRKKTDKEFTTFLSPEAVDAIEKYLILERRKADNEHPLFSKSVNTSIAPTRHGIAEAYRRLNESLDWNSSKGDFHKVTSHMLRKFFNTQLVNAGMPEEIRKHLMGHTIHDKVRDAYFIANQEELERVYIEYLPNITINPSKTLTLKSFEFSQLEHKNKKLRESLEKLSKEVEEINKYLRKLEREND